MHRFPDLKSRKNALGVDNTLISADEFSLTSQRNPFRIDTSRDPIGSVRRTVYDNLETTVNELAEREENDEESIDLPRRGKDSSILNSDLAERRTMAKSDLMKSDAAGPTAEMPRAPLGSPKLQKEVTGVDMTDSVVSAMTPLLERDGKVSPRI